MRILHENKSVLTKMRLNWLFHGVMGGQCQTQRRGCAGCVRKDTCRIPSVCPSFAWGKELFLVLISIACFSFLAAQPRQIQGFDLKRRNTLRIHEFNHKNIVFSLHNVRCAFCERKIPRSIDVGWQWKGKFNTNKTSRKTNCSLPTCHVFLIALTNLNA